MALAKISVAGMRDVVRGLEQGIETLIDSRSSLRSTLSRFYLDTSRSAALQPAVDWARAELPGVRRRLALAEALEGTDPAWPVGTVELDDVADISSMDPEQAAKEGKEAAAALRDGRGVPDDDVIDQILEMQHDPYFASAFAGELSAEELAALVVRLSAQRTVQDGYTDPETLAERNAWHGRLLGGMSTTLATATRATGELALPAGYAQRWVDEITAEVPGPTVVEGDGMVDHANALGVLLTTGTFSRQFLGTVADGVYEYERAFQSEHGGAVWAPRGSDPGSRYGGVYDADGNLFRDPIAGVMTALGNNPRAAQDFFGGGADTTIEVDGHELAVSDRLKYLIQDRTWAVDATNGASLGGALEAATTVLRDRGTAGRTSAEIASQTFALIGDKTGDGADGGFLGIGADDGWKMWDGMRPHVAQMLASYGADVHRVVIIDADDLRDGWALPDSGTLFPDDMPYGAVMDKAHLAKIVATLGEDQETITPFLTGVMQANNLAVSTGLQRAAAGENGDRAIADFLRGIKGDHSSPSVTNASTVLGWALDTAYGGDLADEAVQKKRMEAVADALSFATALPFVPEIKLAWLKWGSDQVQERTLDAIRENAPSDATLTYEALDDQAQQDLGDSTMNLLLLNGYFDDTSLAGIESPPESVIVRSSAGDALYFRTDAQEYMEWLASSSMQSVLAESVVGVYADQWERIR